MKKTTKRKGYKKAIRELVDKLGGVYIDRMSVSLYCTDRWPKWFTEFCESFDKQPRDVANDMINYRNSMGYVYKQMGI